MAALKPPNIPLRRTAQAIHEMGAAMNRRINNVGGGGQNNSVGSYVTGIGTSWVTVVSSSVTLNQASELLAWSYVNFNRTAGTIGETFFAEILVDSEADHSHLD